MACSVGDDPHSRKLFMNSLGMKCACGCEGEPDVAKFARRLDALEATCVEARTFDLGSRPRGAPQIDVLFAHHTITWDSFSIVSLVRNMPEVQLRPDEVEAIVSDLTRRFDKMMRTALLGGDPK